MSNYHPFVAGPPIEDPHSFVGRRDELKDMVDHMIGAQPTSINIYGERRIGKTSLLNHFVQTWQQRVDASSHSRFVVAYLALRNVQPRTQQDFYTNLANTLHKRPSVQNHPELVACLQKETFDGPAFCEVLHQWQQHQVLPVLCLDDFEALLDHRTVFDTAFYDYLRSLLDANLIMFIIASKKSIDTYQRRYHLTSRFFNLGHILHLQHLKPEEAEALVCLPTKKNRDTPCLSRDEQHCARTWAGQHPYLLQLAAKYLAAARAQQHDTRWAKQHFDQEARRLPGTLRLRTRAARALGWLLWLPRSLGRLAIQLGNIQNEVAQTLVGMIIIVVIILALIGVVQPDVIQRLVQQAFGS